MTRWFTMAVAVVGLALPPVAGADEISIDRVPPAVRVTIEQEAQGGTIKEIERETDDGRTVYEVEINKGGRDYEIHVAEDGRIVKRDD